MAKDNYARRETFGRIPRTIPVSHAETLRRSEAKGHGFHRSGDNTWQPHFLPGKRLGFGTFILNKYEQKSLHSFGRSIFIALCLARGNSGQVQATQGFSAYHFLFQALTLVAECIVQGIMFTLFYQRKRGSAFFSEDGHC